MVVQILVDNPDSWIVPFARGLMEKLVGSGSDASLLFDPNEVKKGDILCLLACEKVFDKLSLNKHNLVVHESALPQGKGWSPLTWQVLEGKNEIPITLFEAEKDVDSGPIYYQELIKLKGDELIDEIRTAQGQATVNLIMKFIANFPNNKGIAQAGNATYYKRRVAKDSLLSMDKTLKEQFNLLRVVDNERYPAFFEYKGVKYKVTINKL